MLLVFLLMPMAIAETTKTCIDSSTLQIIMNKTIAIDDNTTYIETSENVHCPGGCGNGECKSIKSSMPIEIYIFLCLTSVVTMFISFFKPDVLIFKFIALILFITLGAASFNLNRIFCEYTSSGWDCFVHQYTATNLAYLWFGLGAVMLIYAVMSSIIQPFQEIAKRV